MMQDPPPPPPGFQVVGAGQNVPPPPPGFRIVGEAPRPQTRPQARPAPQAAPVASPQTAQPQMQAAPMQDAPAGPDWVDGEYVGQVVRPRQEGLSPEAQAAADRYAQANPNDTGFRTVEYGQPGYPGSNSRWDDASQTYVALTPEEVKAKKAYEAVLQQERDAAARAQEMGIRHYSEPDFFDQMTAPLNDEMAAVVGYGKQGIGNLLRQLTGREVEVSAADRARAYSTLSREGQREFERENPAQALVGGLLGGLAVTPAAGAVSTAGGRILQAGALGAATGAAGGEGVGGRVGGAALGGALGAGLGVVGEAIPASSGLLSRQIDRARMPSMVRANRSERQVGGALARALERDKIDAATMVQNIDNLSPGRLPFEAGGENVVGLAETIAQVPGQARTDITRGLLARQDDASNRIATRIGESFGAEGNGFQVLRESIKARGAQAETGMAAMADEVVPLDTASVRALRSSLSSKAVKDAATDALADLTDESAAVANRLFGLGDEVIDNPAGANLTIRQAQDISYALKEAASRAYRGGFNSRGEALQNLSTAIRGNARDRVPAYNQWLRDFGDASDTIDALRVGRNVMAKANEKNAMSAPELRARWSEWSDAAKENYRLGVGEAILDQARSQGGVTAMRKLLKNEELADRVRIAFGTDDAFAKFMQAADEEVAMQGINNQVLAGSQTARRQAGRADLEQQGFNPLDMVDAVTSIGNPVAMGQRALKELTKRLPRNDRSIIGNEELNGLLGSALTDPDVMRRLLSETSVRENATRRARQLGLLNIPGVTAAGQDRARGLLRTNP